MDELRLIQETLQSYLLSGDKTVEHFLLKPKIAPQARLRIYGNAYSSRLVEVLMASFPKLYEFMGEDDFFSMARKYIDYYPSQHYSLRIFGQYMPDFLRHTHPYRKQPMLSEIALYEYTLDLVSRSEDRAVLTTLEEMKGISPESFPLLRFELHPSVRMVRLRWNINDLQSRFLTSNLTKPWVFWKKTTRQSYYLSCSEPEACLIQACLEKQTFGELCSGLSSWLPEEEIAGYVSDQITKWLKNEMLTAIHLP